MKNNTKPNRDITAEIEHTKECIEFMAEDFRRDCICFMKPTTSTEWEKIEKTIEHTFYRFSDGYLLDIIDNEFESIEDVRSAVRTTIKQALTTRTDELLGALKMEKKDLVNNQGIGFYGTEEELNKRVCFQVAYNQAVDEFNEKLATLRDKYEK